MTELEYKKEFEIMQKEERQKANSDFWTEVNKRDVGIKVEDIDLEKVIIGLNDTEFIWRIEKEDFMLNQYHSTNWLNRTHVRSHLEQSLLSDKFEIIEYRLFNIKYNFLEDLHKTKEEDIINIMKFIDYAIDKLSRKIIRESLNMHNPGKYDKMRKGLVWMWNELARWIDTVEQITEEKLIEYNRTAYNYEMKYGWKERL